MRSSLIKRRRRGDWATTVGHMRIYVSGVQHESSSFSPIPTSFRSFEQWNWSADKPNDADGFGYGEACRLAGGRQDGRGGRAVLQR